MDHTTIKYIKSWKHQIEEALQIAKPIIMSGNKEDAAKKNSYILRNE